MSVAKKSPEKATEKKATAKTNATAKIEKTNISQSRVNDILNPTADGRIKKLANFQILAEKHNFLINKKQELDQFIISSDGTKEKVELKNAAGYSLEVSNSQVVEEVLTVMQETLNKFLTKSEADILQFTI